MKGQDPKANDPARVPSGSLTLRRSPSDLDALSVVTPEDVEAARVMWERLAPAGYRGLIDAKPDHPERRRS